MEDLESSAKKYSVKIFSQFLKFSVFRAQFSGSHFGNSQFRSEIDGQSVTNSLAHTASNVTNDHKMTDDLDRKC